MKKLVFVCLVLTFIGLLAGLLLFDPLSKVNYVEIEDCKISDFNLINEMSSALGKSALNKEDFKISNFYATIDNDGFITYMNVNASYKTGYSRFKYDIMYSTEDGKGKFKIYRSPCLEDQFKGTGIDTFAQYINSLPKENISSIKSRGYYNSIYFKTSLQSYLIKKGTIEPLENNKDINLENVYEVTCTYNKDSAPTFYYLTDM
ncbi:MAG: hypothetical protein K0R50_224 [Eubacterium sp.]|jgi:hypothetical protein|nr:hypothetical protein [Eubacterium sp.]